MGAESDGYGLGSASTLLQLIFACNILQMGLGTALSAGAPSAASGTQTASLRNSRWRETLGRAQLNPFQVLLMAVFALIQARGGCTDFITLVGLTASTASFLFSSLLVLVIAGFGDADAELPEVSSAGDVLVEMREGDSRKWRLLAKGGPALLGVLRALAQLLLLFAAAPKGLGLVCASVFVRLALVLSAVGSWGLHLGLPSLGALAAARADAERVAVSTASLVGSIALLDHIAWGESSLMLAPLQPVLYCTLAGVAQIGLIFVVHLTGQGRVQEGDFKPELDFKFALVEDEDGNTSTGVESLRSVSVVALYLSLALGVGRVVAGTFGVEPSLSGMCIRWGEPLTATAVLLMSTLYAAYCLEYFIVSDSSSKEASSVAEVEEEERAAAALGPMDFVKVVLSGARFTIPALVALQASLPAAAVATGEDESWTTALAQQAFKVPFMYGLILVAFALMLQVAMVVLFAAWHADVTPFPQPPFDCTGTINWEPESAVARKAAACIRTLTVTSLFAGLTLGWCGLGVALWSVLLVVLFPLVYFMLPSESKQIVGDVLSIFAHGLGFAGRWVEAITANWREASEAAAAAKATKKAAVLEQEDSAEAKGSKGAAKDDWKAAKKAGGSKKKR